MLRCFATDMHDDFKPQFKDKPAMTVQDSIAEARLVAIPCSVIGLQTLQVSISYGIVLLCTCVERVSDCLCLQLHTLDMRPSGIPTHSWLVFITPHKHVCMQDLASHRVFLYMKGEPAAPQCGFSQMACRILDAYGEAHPRSIAPHPVARERDQHFNPDCRGLDSRFLPKAVQPVILTLPNFTWLDQTLTWTAIAW